jgi:hypothetical protein
MKIYMVQQGSPLRAALSPGLGIYRSKASVSTIVNELESAQNQLVCWAGPRVLHSYQCTGTSPLQQLTVCFTTAHGWQWLADTVLLGPQQEKQSEGLLSIKLLHACGSQHNVTLKDAR